MSDDEYDDLMMRDREANEHWFYSADWWSHGEEYKRYRSKECPFGKDSEDYLAYFDYLRGHMLPGEDMRRFETVFLEYALAGRAQFAYRLSTKIRYQADNPRTNVFFLHSLVSELKSIRYSRTPIVAILQVVRGTSRSSVDVASEPFTLIDADEDVEAIPMARKLEYEYRDWGYQHNLLEPTSSIFSAHLLAEALLRSCDANLRRLFEKAVQGKDLCYRHDGLYVFMFLVKKLCPQGEAFYNQVLEEELHVHV